MSRRDSQALCIVSLVTRVVWMGTLLMVAEWGGESVSRPFKALLVSSDIKTTHNIGP